MKRADFQARRVIGWIMMTSSFFLLPFPKIEHGNLKSQPNHGPVVDLTANEIRAQLSNPRQPRTAKQRPRESQEPGRVQHPINKLETFSRKVMYVLVIPFRNGLD